MQKISSYPWHLTRIRLLHHPLCIPTTGLRVQRLETILELVGPDRKVLVSHQAVRLHLRWARRTLHIKKEDV